MCFDNFYQLCSLLSNPVQCCWKYIKQMIKGKRQFSFPEGIWAKNLSHAPEQDAIMHVLPPQTFTDPIQSQQSIHREQSNSNRSRFQSSNMSLQYSADVNAVRHPQSHLSGTSPFERNRAHLGQQKIIVKTYDKQIEVRVVGSMSKEAEIHSKHTKTSQQNYESSWLKGVGTSNIKQDLSSSNKKQSQPLARKLNFSGLNGHLSRINDQQFAISSDRGPEAKSKITQLQELNATIGMQYQNVRQRLLIKESQIQKLRGDYEKLQEEYKEAIEYREAFHKMEGEFQENKNMVNLFVDEIEQQKHYIAKLEQNNEFANKRLEEIKQQLDKNQENIRRIEEDNKQELKLKEEKVIKLSLQLDQKNLKNQQLQITVAQLQQQLSQSRQHQNNLQLQITRLKQQFSQQLQINAEKFLGQIEDMKLSSRTEKQQLCFKYQNQKDQITKLLQQQKQFSKVISHSLQESKLKQKQTSNILAQTIDELNRSKTQLQQYQIRLSDKKAKFNDYSEKTSLVVSQKQKKISDLQTSIIDLELRIKQLQRNLSKNTHELKQKQIQLSDIKQQLTLRRQRYEQLQSLNSKLSDQLSQTNLRNNKLTIDLKQKQSRIIMFNETIEDNRVKIQKLITQKSNLTIDNQQLKEKVDRFTFQIEQGKLAKHKLQQQLKKSEQGSFQLQKRLSELIFENSSKDIRISELQTTLNTLEQEIKNLKQAFNNSEKALSSYKIERVQIERQNRQFSGQVKRLTQIIISKKQKQEKMLQKMRNYDEIFTKYKQTFAKLKSDHEAKWLEMKQIYQSQLTELSTKVKQYAQIENSKKNFKSFKNRMIKLEAAAKPQQALQIKQ